jgi:hypothetical protein
MGNPTPTEGGSLGKKVLRWLAIYLLIPGTVAATPAAICSGPQWWAHLTAAISRSPADGSTESTAPAGPDPMLPASPAGPSSPLSPDVLSATAIEEALRFDVTPAWIIRQWPRVSAGLGDLRLQGYRVPLVSGTAEDDLAGALTYYFNSQQQLARITFSGATGDPRRLIRWLVDHFAFARRLTNDPGVILYEVQGPDRRPQSTLSIRPVPVVKASDALARYNVALSIERPQP